MGTVETIIVFSALMALIALVTVGIDWIGKPLKNRRFIPRIYRFDDEKLPTDAYGHTTLNAADANPAAVGAYIQPAPIVVATLPDAAVSAPMMPVAAPAAPLASPIAEHASAPATQQAPAAPPATASQNAALRGPSSFSDSLAEPAPASPELTATAAHAFDGDLTDLLATDPNASPAAPTIDIPSAASTWTPGLPLDMTVQDRKPNLATKAERFWMASAALADHSHFDAENQARMTAGKAPRRLNPRTGRAESMQLTGLRQASQPDEVSMHWPNESVDPWNAT